VRSGAVVVEARSSAGLGEGDVDVDINPLRIALALEAPGIDAEAFDVKVGAAAVQELLFFRVLVLGRVDLWLACNCQAGLLADVVQLVL
jgi:hypothetical protein